MVVSCRLCPCGRHANVRRGRKLAASSQLLMVFLAFHRLHVCARIYAEGRRWQRSRVGRAAPQDSQAEKGSFASWSVCAVLRRSWNHNYQSLGAGAGPAPRLGTTTLCTSTFVASPLNCSVPRHRQPWANPGAGAGTFPARY